MIFLLSLLVSSSHTGETNFDFHVKFDGKIVETTQFMVHEPKLMDFFPNLNKGSEDSNQGKKLKLITFWALMLFIEFNLILTKVSIKLVFFKSHQQLSTSFSNNKMGTQIFSNLNHYKLVTFNLVVKFPKPFVILHQAI